MVMSYNDKRLKLISEEILEPERPIIDAHHHLWKTRQKEGRYVLEDLWDDTESGHNIRKTVFVECRSSYGEDGPDHLKSVGETNFVAALARNSEKDPDKATIAAIIGYANLIEIDDLKEVLDAHQAVGHGLFRGIRGMPRNKRHRDFPYWHDDYRAGVKALGDLGLTNDTWHPFDHNRDFLAFAKAVPRTTIILNHFGGLLGGLVRSSKDDVYDEWRKDMAEVAECPNVVAKLGGMAMPNNPFGWYERDTLATSDEYVSELQDYYLYMIECFGPDRCMFESNFPVDKHSISYHVLWNAFKKIVTGFSEDEKQSIFYKTAARVYRV